MAKNQTKTPSFPCHSMVYLNVSGLLASLFILLALRLLWQQEPTVAGAIVAILQSLSHVMCPFRIVS
uniref:Uncharacterized protein n=1 Tax=Amblyomma cajennense TaxID=34607 RepID=A0A023FB57_AMBCJ